MNDKPRKNGKSRWAIARGVCIGAVLVLGVISAIFHTGTGTLSNMGIGYVAYVCPLGALESLFGQFAFVPRALIALVAVAAVTLLVGKSFCSWVCPVPPLRRFLGGRRVEKADAEERAEAGSIAAKNYEEGVEPSHGKVDSRHIVLCGALGTTAIFGFPAFCFICPIGLTFAIVVGLVRLVGYNEPSISLLIFAVMLVLELVFLRKWCSKFCPVGALLSLISKFNKTLKPHVDEEKCLRTAEGTACGACSSVCPELTDPQSDKGIAPLSDCTRCGKCVDACPGHAISFPFFPKK